LSRAAGRDVFGGAEEKGTEDFLFLFFETPYEEGMSVGVWEEVDGNRLISCWQHDTTGKREERELGGRCALEEEEEDEKEEAEERAEGACQNTQ